MPRWEELGQPVAIRAIIDCGAEEAPIKCTVTMIAERSARLKVPNANSVPESFILIFVGSPVRRQCVVRMRQSNQIGVEMVKM